MNVPCYSRDDSVERRLIRINLCNKVSNYQALVYAALRFALIMNVKQHFRSGSFETNVLVFIGYIMSY
jgi:hypothetical protein